PVQGRGRRRLGQIARSRRDRGADLRSRRLRRRRRAAVRGPGAAGRESRCPAPGGILGAARILTAPSTTYSGASAGGAPAPGGPAAPTTEGRMFYELRRYDVAAGKLAALVDRFGSFTVHKWKQYGFRLIGFWTPVVADRSNQLVYVWGWESLEERAKKNAAWRADPEGVKKWAETEKDGPLVNRVDNQLMEPTSYSQIDHGESYGPDASSRSPYLFELREYQAMPGKIQNITDRFGNFTCGAFKKHGFRQGVYWQNGFGRSDT